MISRDCVGYFIFGVFMKGDMSNGARVKPDSY